MDEIATVFDVDRIKRMHASRSQTIRSLLDPEAAAQKDVSTRPSALDYAILHHFLEGAELAARATEHDRFSWYRTNAEANHPEWFTETACGPRVLLSPNLATLPRSAISETPYVLLGPDTRPASAPLRELCAAAFATATDTAFGELLTGHAAVVCLLRNKELGDTLDSWTISRLPGTVFVDHVNEPAVLARDLIHEAGHNWLNDALASCGVKIPAEAKFFSPWKKTARPAFGFIHACWAFPLTMIYTARALDRTSGNIRGFLRAYLSQQRELLQTTAGDHARALDLITDDELRHRLDLVHRSARTL